MAPFDANSILKVANTPLILSQFLHECVDDLIGEKKPNNFDSSSYNSSDIAWTLENYNKAKVTVQTFYRQCILDDRFDLKAITNDDDLLLSEDVVKALRNCFELRRNEIWQAMAKEAVLKDGHNLVEAIDWRLKWVLGSSKLVTIREPLLQVDLQCVRKALNTNNNDSGRNTVNFEMNAHELDDLIAQLEKAQIELKS